MRIPSGSARASLESRVNQYQQQVGEQAVSYLKARGLTKNTANIFRLGYSGDTGDWATSNRLTIPYLTPAGPLLIKFRCLEEHDCKDLGHPKYSYDSGSETHLFNAQTLLTADRVVLVEGELDAVAVEQTGAAAVGYPGATQWRAGKHSHWPYCFDGVDEVIVLADGDKVGREAADQVAESLRTAVAGDIRLVYLPNDEDANSLISREGDLAFLERIGFL